MPGKFGYNKTRLRPPQREIVTPSKCEKGVGRPIGTGVGIIFAFRLCLRTMHTMKKMIASKSVAVKLIEHFGAKKCRTN